MLTSPILSWTPTGLISLPRQSAICAALARCIATVLNGLAVQVVSGTIEKELRLVVARTILALPSQVIVAIVTCDSGQASPRSG